MGFFKTTKVEKENEIIDVITSNSSSNKYIESICIAHAIDLISRMIAQTELQVYRYDSKTKRVEEKKDDVYYRLNIKPNLNENGTNLKNKLVKKILLDGKALIVFTKNKDVDYMYLAESYETNERITRGKIFSNVIIKDDEKNEFTFNKDFSIDRGECLYFTYENDKLKSSLGSFSNNSSNLLDTTINSYKRANTNKWRLKNPGGQAKLIDTKTGEPMDYEEYKKKITDGLLSDDDSVILLSEVFDLTLLNKDLKKDLTDYEKLVKNIGDKIAMSFNIPLDVFYGTKTEKSNGNSDFITFACEPIMKSIEDTINGGIIEEKDYIKGEKIKFNRFCMQHIDISSLGTSLDKLTSIGFSFNQICRMLNLPEVDADWANEHHITKNYADVKGGEEDE